MFTKQRTNALTTIGARLRALLCSTFWNNKRKKYFTARCPLENRQQWGVTMIIRVKNIVASDLKCGQACEVMREFPTIFNYITAQTLISIQHSALAQFSDFFRFQLGIFFSFRVTIFIQFASTTTAGIISFLFVKGKFWEPLIALNDSLKSCRIQFINTVRRSHRGNGSKLHKNMELHD